MGVLYIAKKGLFKLLKTNVTYGSGTGTEYVRIWDLGIVTGGSLLDLLIL